MNTKNTEQIEKKTYYLIKENFIQSVLSDLTSFLVLIIPLFLNYYYLGNKWYLDTFFLVLAILYMNASVNSKNKILFKNKEDLIKYLTENE